MADEDMDRQMEFLLQQQAQSAGRIQQIEEIILDLARGTRDRFQVTDNRMDNVDEKFAALVDAQVRTEESMKKTDEKLAALVDSQIRTAEDLKEIKENVKKTDKALRNLIGVVDRYLESRNGNSQQ